MHMMCFYSREGAYLRFENKTKKRMTLYFFTNSFLKIYVEHNFAFSNFAFSTQNTMKIVGILFLSLLCVKNKYKNKISREENVDQFEQNFSRLFMRVTFSSRFMNKKYANYA